MNKKQKQELRQRQTARQLMGISQLTGYGVRTAEGELAFFLIKPDNLSVLSEEGVRGRVTALTHLLCAMPELRILALDSRESFQRNQEWYRQRLEQEELPALRELLRQDSAHLDEIQTTTASAREFVLVFRLDQQSGESDEVQLRQMEKRNVRERRERYSLPAFLIKTPHSYASRIRRTTRKDTSLRRLPDIGHYSPTFGAAQCPCVLRRTSGLYRAPAFRHAVPHSRFALKIHVQSCDAAPRPVVAVVIRSAAVLIHNGAAAQRERFLKFRARACESR